SPVGKVTLKVVDERLEVLTCQAFGFYPKEIQATWTRDGEACVYETLRRNMAPNSDGTCYVWLSIDIDPKERDRFRCHLEHEGLQEPLVLAWKEETATGCRIPVGIVAGIILGAVIVLIWWWKRKLVFYQKVKSPPDDVPSEVIFSSPTWGTDNEMQLESTLQSKITSDDEASYRGRSPHMTPEVLMPTLRRREWKQQMLKRSNTWAGDWDTLAKAGATESEERAQGWIW
ncbi:HLA class I histocompatibility antigen, alpha chain F, partial [Ophiophagus hannah]